MIAVLLYGLINGLIISLVALAFQINFKIFKMFDLSLAGVFVGSSYFFITLQQSLIASTSLISLVLSLLLTFMFCWALTFLIYGLVFKKFLKQKSSGLTLMIVSLAVYIIIINIIALFFGSNTQIINIKQLSYYSTQIGSIVFTYTQITQFFLGLIVICIILYFLTQKGIGNKINALSENSELFLTLGHNVHSTRKKVLLLSSVLIATASILKSVEFGIEPYSMGFQTLLLGIIASLIGGIHSFKGALIGGLFIGVINNIGAWFFSGAWQETTAFVALLVILLFKKNGFFNVNLRTE